MKKLLKTYLLTVTVIQKNGDRQQKFRDVYLFKWSALFYAWWETLAMQELVERGIVSMEIKIQKLGHDGVLLD
jgi:hypothetical protein